ncbi:hypothetical protein SteCoe_28471 [Stentor coeruleus]|uniref:non-specific serine/threonine protein kinase n=1 Tax=Stentor coeruleus TaxID=5963 RepID=A0A1R2B843_9CILI|nr:hypothetical protein SteCoe_28471 [Stentor coeruleus]
MRGIIKPRLYSEVNFIKSEEELNLSSVQIAWGKQENYEILRKLCRGKYSDVYEGLDMTSKSKVILKILKPIKRSKVLREIKILRTLESFSGVPKLLDIVKDNSTKTSALITEHYESQDIISLFSKIDDIDARFYLYEILKILDFAHSKGIMHRDIKPNNIIINHNTRTVKIIDWCLAEFYIPNTPYNVKVASRYYKAPELLVNYQYYDYSIDMWSFGVMFAGLIFGKNPFFHGHDNYDQLVKIVRMIGTVKFYEYLEKFDISLDDRFEDLKNHYKPKVLGKMVSSEMKLANDDALDLIGKILVFDHSERLLPSEAMKHPYFDPVREMRGNF